MANNETHNNTTSNKDSVTATLMTSSGQACKVTGFAISGTSTLYFTNALTSSGIALIQYLPHLVNAANSSQNSTSFFDHMKNNATLNWKSACYLGVALIGGILLRKTGHFLTNQKNITYVESFMNKGKDKE
jgi:hypothetical protein